MAVNPVAGAKALRAMGKKILTMDSNKFLSEFSPVLDVRDAARGLRLPDLTPWGQVAALPKYADKAANEALRKSMVAKGFTEPIEVNKRGEIVSGVRRAIVAQQLGIPVKYIKLGY